MVVVYLFIGDIICANHTSKNIIYTMSYAYLWPWGVWIMSFISAFSLFFSGISIHIPLIKGIIITRIIGLVWLGFMAY